MDSNVADLLTRAAASEPEKAAICEAESGRSMTWRELEELTERVATGFSAMGMVAGFRVLVVTTNCIEFVAAYLGAVRLGLVAVPANPRSVPGELARMITDAGARVVIAEEQTIELVRAALTELAGGVSVPRVYVTRSQPQGQERSWEDLVAERAPQLVPPGDPERLAVLLYTSGTSGQPRAAMLSHRALLASIEQVARIGEAMINGRDVVLGMLPLFHVYGLNAVLGQVLRQHARLVLVDGFDPEESLDLIEDEAVSVVPLAPPVLEQWLAQPGLEDRLDPVRLVLSGAAPLDPLLAESFTERVGLPVHQGYGLTEAAPVVTSTLCSAHPDPRSVGAAVPGVEIRLTEDGDRRPEQDDTGEIRLRGENLFSGYWPDGREGPDDEGWWSTGDVGYLDATGDLFLVDRVKELVIVSGFNVYPSEVEDVIAELSQVAESAVIGTENTETGEAVVAYVRPSGEAARMDAEQLVEVVRRHCAQRLARFKRPTVVHVVEELPYTVTGKVQKGRLRAAERSRLLGAGEQSGVPAS